MKTMDSNPLVTQSRQAASGTKLSLPMLPYVYEASRPKRAGVEAIVFGPSRDSRVTLSKRCVDTGVDGDLNPAMVNAHDGPAPAASPLHTIPTAIGLASAKYRDLASDEILPSSWQLCHLPVTV